MLRRTGRAGRAQWPFRGARAGVPLCLSRSVNCQIADVRSPDASTFAVFLRTGGRQARLQDPFGGRKGTSAPVAKRRSSSYPRGCLLLRNKPLLPVEAVHLQTSSPRNCGADDCFGPGRAQADRQARISEAASETIEVRTKTTFAASWFARSAPAGCSRRESVFQVRGLRADLYFPRAA